MKYPLLTPEKVTRDVTDIFGGYNHNLRIGDNEFYDMENLSSDSYPLLSVRKKRGALSTREYSDITSDVKGILYHGGLIYCMVTPSLDLFAVHIMRGSTELGSWVSDDGDSERTIVPMGAKLIILPDNKIINTADDHPGTENIDNEKLISSEITIQPCLADGTVLSVDYIGDEIPQAPIDGYVWLDTRNNPAALKKYIASQAMWQNFLSTYVKISANSAIITGFKVGDGVKISGITGDDTNILNNTSIIKSIPDDHSIVITGIIDPMPNKYILTAEYTQGSHTIHFCTEEQLEQGLFANKKVQINNKIYNCTSSTEGTEIPAIPIYSDVHLSDDGVTLTAEGTGGSATSIIYVTDNAFGSGDLSGQQICFGNISLRKFATIIGQGSHSAQDPTHPSGRYIVIDRTVTLDENTVISPISYTQPEGLYRVDLTFEEEVKVSIYDKACPTLDNQYAQTGGEVKISRKMPKMDFVIESGNRLWGCRYGENNDGDFVNEIYCSKLGDPTNWNVYEGIATDSYAASCGTEGEWTGAFNYRGYPTFFKQHYIHTVYGSNPPFQIKDTEARGIQKGSSGSIALLNEVLFYKSVHGICAYTGGLPEEVSGVLGDMSYKNAVGCAYRGKYYVEMQDTDNHPALFVFDTVKGLWHKEAAINAVQMTASDDNIIYTAPVDDLIGIGRLFGNAENSVRWYAETGIFGLGSPDKKYISKINLRLMLPVGSSVFISIEYDSSGRWEKMTNIIGHSLMPFSFSIKPRRCDHFRLRLEGIGDMKLYSVSKTIEQGSDR